MDSEDKKIPAPYEIVMAVKWCVTQLDVNPNLIKITDHARKAMLDEKPPVDEEEILEVFFYCEHYYNTGFWKEERYV